MAECKISDSISFGYLTKSECEGITVQWQDDKCIVGGSTAINGEDGCEKTWDESNANCIAYGVSITDVSSEEDCNNYEIKLVDAEEYYCTYSNVGQNECKASYISGDDLIEIKCILDDGTELSDDYRLKSKSACETELVWQSGTCSNIQVTNKEDCEANAEFTKGTEAECVDKASSSNSFLVFKFALVLISCLLF